MTLFPYLPKSDIDQTAESLRRQVAGESLSARVDLEALVFDHFCQSDGMAFSDEDDLGHLEDGSKILGVTRPLSATVQVDRSLKQGPPGRYRFTVAHELGHWVLHRPLFLAAADQTTLFSDDTSEEPPELVGLHRNIFPSAGQRSVPREEWQANRFAIGLLIDENLLRISFRRRFGCASRSSPGGPTERRRLSTELATQRGLSGSLAEEFGLSAEAMAIALETRGYVPDGRQATLEG